MDRERGDDGGSAGRGICLTSSKIARFRESYKVQGRQPHE